MTGRVQGVGYRYFARQEAMELGLGGWVCNRPDGSVEVHVEGAGPSLGEYESRLQSGPPAGEVKDCERIPADSESGFTEFEVRFG